MTTNLTNSTNKVPNVPPLRFPEFTGEWEKCKLGNISEVLKGSGISKDQLSEKGESCILYGELYTKYKSEVIRDIYSKTNIDTTNLVRSHKNDIIIPSSGETAIDISTARCVPYDGVLLGGDLSIIRLKNQDGRFFSYQLNGIRKLDIAKIAQGVSVVHLYGENLKRLKITYPILVEQNKIADLLSKLDTRIETQNKIIEDLKTLKSAIRKQIYSNMLLEYESTKQIKDVLGYEQPTKYLVADTEYSNDNSLTPVLTANKAFILGYTTETSGIYKKGQCIILDDFTLDCKFVDFPFKVKSSAIKILTAKEEINIRYVYEYLKYLEMETIEHKRHYIAEVEPMEILVPSIEEMESIARTFYLLDKRINIAEQMLKHYQLQKQYLLQQMFI